MDFFKGALTVLAVYVVLISIIFFSYLVFPGMIWV